MGTQKNIRYRPKMHHEKCITIVKDTKNTQFKVSKLKTKPGKSDVPKKIVLSVKLPTSEPDAN